MGWRREKFNARAFSLMGGGVEVGGDVERGGAGRGGSVYMALHNLTECINVSGSMFDGMRQNARNAPGRQAAIYQLSASPSSP